MVAVRVAAIIRKVCRFSFVDQSLSLSLSVRVSLGKEFTLVGNFQPPKCYQPASIQPRAFLTRLIIVARDFF